MTAYLFVVLLSSFSGYRIILQVLVNQILPLCHCSQWLVEVSSSTFDHLLRQSLLHYVLYSIVHPSCLSNTRPLPSTFGKPLLVPSSVFLVLTDGGISFLVILPVPFISVVWEVRTSAVGTYTNCQLLDNISHPTRVSDVSSQLVKTLEDLCIAHQVLCSS